MRGQQQAAPHALEQLEAQVGFKAADLARECRLRDVQLLRGFRYRAEVGDRGKRGEMLEVHALCIIGIDIQVNNALDMRVPTAQKRASRS
jgi:hypothetical protein